MQDEGSQIAALLAGAAPRQQILDLCAGAGGKTLALAAGMQNTRPSIRLRRRQTQLRPIFERLKRAGVAMSRCMEAGNTGQHSRSGRDSISCLSTRRARARALGGAAPIPSGD